MGSLLNKRTDKPVLFCCAQEQCVKSRAFSRTWGIKYSKLMPLQYISRWSCSVVHKDEIRKSPTRKVWRGHYMNVWFSSHYISFFFLVLGLVNKFLSASYWIPLSRLTYSAYLLHPLVLTSYFGSFQHTVEYSDKNFVSTVGRNLVW